MDRAYEGNSIRSLAIQNGFIPVVPPKKNRKNPWKYDKEFYKRRNEVERYFLRLNTIPLLISRQNPISKSNM